MDYSETYKRQRRYLQSYFSKQRMPDYYPLQLRETRRLLRDLLRDPNGHKKHIQRMAGGITMMLTYGHQVDSIEDRFIRIAEKGVATIRAAGIVGAHIVDLVPWRESSPIWRGGVLKAFSAAYPRLGARRQLQMGPPWDSRRLVQLPAYSF